MKFLKENYAAVFLLIVGLGLVFPLIFLPWSLIDDGERLIISQQMSESLAGRDLYNFFYHPVDQISGRFRPVYWIFHWLVFLVFGKNAWLHHLVRIGVFLITSLMFYLLVSRFISKRAGFFSLLFFVFFAPNIENWWRLGPQEPLIVFFLLAGFWFLVKKKGLFSALFFTLAVLTKETAISVFLPIFLLLLFAPKSFYNTLKPVVIKVGLISLLLVVILFSLKKTTGYATAYQFSLIQIQESFKSYVALFSSLGLRFLLLLAFATFLLSLVKNLKRRKVSVPFLLSSLGLFWFILAFIIQLPWQHPLGRYLLPSILGLALFVGIESEKVLSYLKKLLFGRQKIIGWVIAASFSFAWAVFLFYNLLYIFRFSSDYWNREYANSEAVYYIATLTQSNGKIFLNLSDELNAREWFVEIPMHLKLFYARKDIKVKYFNLESDLSRGDVIAVWSEFQRYPPEELEEILAKKTQRKITIKRTAKNFIASPRTFFYFLISGRLFKEGISPFISTKIYYWCIYTVI